MLTTSRPLGTSFFKKVAHWPLHHLVTTFLKRYSQRLTNYFTFFLFFQLKVLFSLIFVSKLSFSCNFVFFFKWSWCNGLLTAFGSRPLHHAHLKKKWWTTVATGFACWLLLSTTELSVLVSHKGFALVVTLTHKLLDLTPVNVGPFGAYVHGCRHYYNNFETKNKLKHHFTLKNRKKLKKRGLRFIPVLLLVTRLTKLWL